ncbi:RagB/SusD family nutrient uptake outer membrane protein [Halosquirtibacter xylanolyticus]|uniref:RagB/SusD family nutrient uptake outer membrane protein n=1 Tax=Halosquirtibacter xylanolyticus TaxID=3374599 RepID=UPI003749ABDE|nr:RagB/SusD family nutrient uptake outer membrane protein [Prolixibacteraceae bacterium]
MKLRHILSVVIITSCLLGCESIIDKRPLDRIDANSVWKEQNTAEAAIFNIYSRISTGFFDTNNGGYIFSTCNVSDESRSKSGWIGSNKVIVPGNMEATRNPMDVWKVRYESIRDCNIAVESLKTSPIEENLRNRLNAEARFVRAWLYFDLTRRYGGVPLITVPQQLNDGIEALKVSRETYENCIDFITKELKESAELLPNSVANEEWGRATKQACDALNGRVLMYAQRWSEAANYSKKVIDSDQFKLYDDYNALFQTNGRTEESIFDKLFLEPDRTHSWDYYNIPYGFTPDFGSQTNPVQEMVDSYEMVNGKAITDPTSGYDPQNPYKDRDPRFNATILYNGAPFKGKLIETYTGGAQGLLKNGLCTVTGYYIRKFIEESKGAPSKGTSTVSWKELRYGEVLLNYAEAQNEAAGPDNSVYSAINQIRNRAGMPDITAGLDKDAMREVIRHERKIELAFENHRYWDLIRWGKAKEVLNDKQFHGMQITKNDDGSFTYDASFIVTRGGTQVFNDRQYLFPIPQSEINKNSNLTQNPGY